MLLNILQPGCEMVLARERLMVYILNYGKGRGALTASFEIKKNNNQKQHLEIMRIQRKYRTLDYVMQKS